mmetsp:Transcript_3110/g.5961  ORF Transcript_3110/g.5961 Transcript_3110/m.5961 type:complete len:249 (-) Transcript_3110:213-959(-)
MPCATWQIGICGGLVLGLYIYLFQTPSCMKPVALERCGTNGLCAVVRTYAEGHWVASTTYPSVECASLNRLTSCKIPTLEQHIGRNCFNVKPTGSWLVPRPDASNVFEALDRSTWESAPWYAALWHAPHLKKKLVGADSGDGQGSSEWEIDRSRIAANGSLPTSHLEVGSYNYFDYRTGSRGTLCHFIVDVVPNFYYMIKHVELVHYPKDPCRVMQSNVSLLLFLVSACTFLYIFWPRPSNKSSAKTA